MEDSRTPSLHLTAVVYAGLGPHLKGIDALLAVHHVAMKRIFQIRRTVDAGRAIETRGVGFVVGKQQLAVCGCIQITPAQSILQLNVFERLGRGIVRYKHQMMFRSRSGMNVGFTAGRCGPTPRVAEPQMWQYVKLRSVGPAVERFYPDANIFGRSFRILDEDIEVSIVIEDAGVQQFELRSRASIAILL